MFKADQSVNYAGMQMPATIISGPHATHGADRWLIRKADDTVTLARASELSPVDDRRERVAAAAYKTMVMRPFTEAGTISRAKYLRIADAVLGALEEPAKLRPLAVGDRIRILRDRLDSASVRAGDILTVTYVGMSSIAADSKGPFPHKWSFGMGHAGTGWERVA